MEGIPLELVDAVSYSGSMFLQKPQYLHMASVCCRLQCVAITPSLSVDIRSLIQQHFHHRIVSSG
jgi:hypothetical protein